MKSLLIILLWSTASATAATYFVRSASAGGATGADWNNAMSVATASTTAANSDIVYMAGGAYTTQAIIPANSGTSSGSRVQWIRATASNSTCTSAAGWSSAFDSQITFSGGGLIRINKNNVTINGVTASGIKITVPSGSGNYGIGIADGSSSTATNITFAYIELAGPGTGAPLSYGFYSSATSHTSNEAIDHCIVHDFVNGAQCYGRDGMLVQYSEFYNIYGGSDGSHPNRFYLGSGTFAACVFQFNKFHDDNTLGCAYEDSANCVSNVYEGNWFYNCIAQQGGICTDSGSDTITSLYVYDNTFSNCCNTPGFQGPVVLLKYAWQAGAAKNNIVYKCGGMWGATGGFGTTVFDHNFTDAAGGDGGTGTITSGSDPFIGATDFHIVSTVGATFPRDKGTSSPGANWNIDMDGNLRGADGTWDIGAMEFVSSGGGGGSPTNFYAAPPPTGSTGNTGLSTLSPWPLDYALSHAGASNNIFLMDGNYPDTGGYQVGASGQKIAAINKWKPVITNSTSFGLFAANTLSNLTVDGLWIDHSTIDGIKLDHPSRGDTIRNCRISFAGWGGSGAVTNGTGTFTGQGILSEQGYGNLFERNLIENGGAWVNHDHGMYVSGTNIVLRSNVVRSNLTWGIQMFSDSPWENLNNAEYNNLLYNNGKGANCYSYSGYTNSFYENTILSLSDSAVKASDTVLLATNNIIIPSSGNLVFEADAGATIKGDYNLSYTATLPTQGGAHDVISSNYGFVDPNHGLYWLKATSAARGAALAGGCGPVDWFGNSQSTVSDIGAFQYNSILASDQRVLDPLASSAPANSLDYWTLPSSFTGLVGMSGVITFKGNIIVQ